jgi:hypothetical protein
MRKRELLVGLLLVASCDKPGGTTNAAAPSASAPASASAATQAIAPEAAAPAASSTAPAASASAASSASSAAVAPPDTIIAQHVLVAYRGARRAPKGITRSKSDAKARAQEALSKIRAGSPFEDIVKQYSDDTGSVDRMGSLGKFHRGDMDPAFGTAAFALRVGEVSDVVETPFGFHVIKRTQ